MLFQKSKASPHQLSCALQNKLDSATVICGQNHQKERRGHEAHTTKVCAYEQMNSQQQVTYEKPPETLLQPDKDEASVCAKYSMSKPPKLLCYQIIEGKQKYIEDYQNVIPEIGTKTLGCVFYLRENANTENYVQCQKQDGRQQGKKSTTIKHGLEHARRERLQNKTVSHGASPLPPSIQIVETKPSSLGFSINCGSFKPSASFIMSSQRGNGTNNNEVVSFDNYAYDIPHHWNPTTGPIII